MDSLCGNALELEDGRGLPVMAMSTQASAGRRRAQAGAGQGAGRGQVLRPACDCCGPLRPTPSSHPLPATPTTRAPPQAYNAFTADQRKAILRHTAGIVHAPIDTLERVGGGGVRCTLAELF
jgi:hypothetical protein